MRFALRNKTKLINAFGEAYYNELIASINSFQSNYTPDCHCERNVGCDNACLLFRK